MSNNEALMIREYMKIIKFIKINSEGGDKKKMNFIKNFFFPL